VIDDDLFSDPGSGELLRDQWDRPIILRPWEDDGPCKAADGKRWICYVEKAHGHYTRASTFAGSLDDGPGLAIWMKRHVALAFANEDNDDLRAIVAGLDYKDKKLDGYIEEAIVRNAQFHSSLKAANNGTAVHRFTEPNSPPTVPQRMRKDVEAFALTLSTLQCPSCDKCGFEIVATEQFVVNDLWQVAGTFDHAIRCDWCRYVMVLDKKTGKDVHPIAMAIQLTEYAYGIGYDVESGRRVELPFELSRKHGVIAHIPLGSGKCNPHCFDLDAGARLANLAAEVRAERLRENDLHRLLGTTTL
jgi:hypothetical protein